MRTGRAIDTFASRSGWLQVECIRENRPSPEVSTILMKFSRDLRVLSPVVPPRSRGQSGVRCSYATRVKRAGLEWIISVSGIGETAGFWQTTFLCALCIIIAVSSVRKYYLFAGNLHEIYMEFIVSFARMFESYGCL